MANKFYDRREDDTKNVNVDFVAEDEQKGSVKEERSLGEIVTFASSGLIIILTAIFCFIIPIFCFIIPGIQETSSGERVSTISQTTPAVKDPNQMLAHHVNDDKGPGEAETVPIVAKPSVHDLTETERRKIVERYPEISSYNIYKEDGVVHIRYSLKDGTCGHDAYVFDNDKIVEYTENVEPLDQGEVGPGKNNGAMPAPY